MVFHPSNPEYPYQNQKHMGNKRKRLDVLAYKKDIDGAEVEIVEEWEGSETFLCWVHSSIKLYTIESAGLGCDVTWRAATKKQFAHHNCFSLVLDDMT